MNYYCRLSILAAREALAGAFAFLQQTDALIIDNRSNFGGSPATVAHYVSYLSEGPPALVSTLHERADRRILEFYTEDLGERSYGASRPIFVLTSAATFSGGEALTYDLQALGRALVIGEVTGGGAHPVTPPSSGRPPDRRHPLRPDHQSHHRHQLGGHRRPA